MKTSRRPGRPLASAHVAVRRVPDSSSTMPTSRPSRSTSSGLVPVVRQLRRVCGRQDALPAGLFRHEVDPPHVDQTEVIDVRVDAPTPRGHRPEPPSSPTACSPRSSRAGWLRARVDGPPEVAGFSDDPSATQRFDGSDNSCSCVATFSINRFLRCARTHRTRSWNESRRSAPLGRPAPCSSGLACDAPQ